MNNEELREDLNDFVIELLHITRDNREKGITNLIDLDYVTFRLEDILYK